MPWYQFKVSRWWMVFIIFFVMWGVFFVFFVTMIQFSNIAYRLCEVSYTIQGSFIPYMTEEDFSDPAITKKLSSTFSQELLFHRRQETNISIFSPQEILSETKLSNLDTYLRTNFPHVKWSTPGLRVVPQLAPSHRLFLSILMATAMALGVIGALLLRRK